MGYGHIPNLYRPEGQFVLAFRDVYALEKIHGTSAHVAWKQERITYFGGDESLSKFKGLFNEEKLKEIFPKFGHPEMTIYGEAYGGRQQGMSAVYGPKLKFVAFDVQIGDVFLSVPDAAEIVNVLGLDFVSYEFGPATLDWLDKIRDLPSVQAARNGMGESHAKEGIVIRPPFEVRRNNDDRVVAKHKTAAFAERVNQPLKPIDLKRLEVLKDAEKVAQEWVVPMRLTHVIGKIFMADEVLTVRRMADVLDAMCEDILREAAGEFEPTKEVMAAIRKRTASMFTERVISAAKTQKGDA